MAQNPTSIIFKYGLKGRLDNKQKQWKMSRQQNETILQLVVKNLKENCTAVIVTKYRIIKKKKSSCLILLTYQNWRINFPV